MFDQDDASWLLYIVSRLSWLQYANGKTHLIGSNSDLPATTGASSSWRNYLLHLLKANKQIRRKKRNLENELNRETTQ